MRLAVVGSHTWIPCRHWRNAKHGTTCAVGAGQPTVEHCDQCKYFELWSAPSIPAAIKSAAAAAVSAIVSTPLSDEAIAARLAVCGGCDALDRSQATEESIGHCSVCRCARTRLSRLEVKAAIPRSTCPRRLWDNLTTS